jgi:hypothetical protein
MSLMLRHTRGTMGRHRQYIDTQLAHWFIVLTFLVNNESYCLEDLKWGRK